MRVWIDAANSPHPLLFAPVSRQLEQEGHEVVVTARDHAQTLELARRSWPELTAIGGESPGGRTRKALTLKRRITGLRAWARSTRPDVALSHNSYAQIVAARSLRIPIVTAMDFEHQPANHLAFRLANLVLLPEAFPGSVARRQGAVSRKVLRYPGLKESLYLGDFEPSAEVLDELGVGTLGERVLVVARTPPSRALYHRMENRLFVESLRRVASQDEVACVALTRHPEQRASLEELGLPNLTIPSRAVDARSLIRAADLFIGAGGTMTREAALMGIPTISVFAAEVPAVDRWLQGEGALSRVSSADQLGPVEHRERDPRPLAELRTESAAILDRFLAAVNAASSRRGA
jgi:predicted glycosyltransferase